MTGDPIARLRAADPLRGELPDALQQMPARPAPGTPACGRLSTALTIANFLLVAAVLFHVVDHVFIQERGAAAMSFESTLGGVAITAAAMLSLMAALRRDRRAALYAVLSGPWIAVAVVAGHFAGHWGELSDPYSATDPGAISHAAALAVVAAGVLLGAVGALARPRWRV